MRLKMNRDLLKTRELFTTNLWQKNFNYPEIILEGYVFSRIKYAFWSFPIRIYPLWDILTLNFSSVDQSCLTLCDPMDSSTPGFPVHHQLPELAQTHIHQISDAIQPSHPLLSPYPSALSFPASGASPKSQIRWPKHWSFSFNISPSNENPGLISFMMDWLDLLAVQETLKSLLQYHSSKASVLRSSA